MESIRAHVSSALGAGEYSGIGNYLDHEDLKVSLCLLKRSSPCYQFYNAQKYYSQDSSLFESPEWPYLVHILAHAFGGHL